ncbi:hypothetical protein ACB092_04G066900 [Castanea dentata]
MEGEFDLKFSMRGYLPIFSLLLPTTTAYSVQFKKTYFDPNDTDTLYLGDAVASNGAVEMTRVDIQARVGWVIYAKKVPLWDSNTGKLTDFSTRFSFTIGTVGSGTSDFAGGGLGLFNDTTVRSHQNHIVLVEFDLMVNKEWNPLFTHVGINNNSIGSAISTHWKTSFHSGDTADVWIIYNATTKNLSVSWTYQNTTNTQENTSLSYEIDLMKVLPERATVGFSAATGVRIDSSLDIKETTGKEAEYISLMVELAIVGKIIIVFVMFWIWKGNKKKTAEIVNVTSIHEDLEKGAGPRRFSYRDLVLATNNFSNERKLGQGGFGAVYKGYLTDLDMPVTVKKISSQLRHRNLLQLIGCCHDGVEFLLVYEYMPNGSLDSHLFGTRSPLSWLVRYKISLKLASSLLYLHEEWEQCVVHRDIKSSNVMLDSNFNVRLGDFGLAQLMDHELGPQTTRLAGTLGYLAPAYITTGRASKESNVYSFGVVALEIAIGRRSSNLMGPNSDMGLVEWIWGLYGRGDLLSAVDRKFLKTNFDEKQIECLMIVGLWSAHPDRNLRLSIRQAIQILKFEVKVPVLPTQMPNPMYHAPTPLLFNSGQPLLTTSIQEGR